MPWSPKSKAKPKIVRKRLADGTVKTYEYKRTRSAAKPRAPDTIAMLIAAYQGSPEWTRLSPARKAHCTTYLRPLAPLANYPAHELKRKHIRSIRDAIAAKGKSGAANGFLNVTSAMLGWGVKADWLEHNPAIGIDMIPGGHLPAWTADQAEKAIASLPEHLRRLVILGLYTGQRRGDLCLMAWSNYDGHRIRVVQGKTGASLVLPVHPTLKAELDAWDRKATTILVNHHGRPWKPASATVGMRKALDRIGFPPGWNIHGIRKLMAASLAETGSTGSEIKSVTGHKTLSMVSLYTESADQERMATAAIHRLPTRK
jgi:integrase